MIEVPSRLCAVGCTVFSSQSNNATTVEQLTVIGGRSSTVWVRPKLLTRTGDAVPQSPSLSGGAGATSATIGASRAMHWPRAFATSSIVHGTVVAFCGRGGAVGPAGMAGFDTCPAAAVGAGRSFFRFRGVFFDSGGLR